MANTDKIKPKSINSSLHLSELFESSWETCFLHLVPRRNQKGTKQINLDWPKNQPTEEVTIKKYQAGHKKVLS